MNAPFWITLLAALLTIVLPRRDKPSRRVPIRRRGAAGLLAAGDYIAGPYPATLEGAVRSGDDAAAALT